MRHFHLSATIALLGITDGVQAQTITFEDVAPTGGSVSVTPQAPYAVSGFVFTPSISDSAIYDSAATAQLRGDPTDFLGFGKLNTISITASDSSLFNFTGFDLGMTNLATDPDVTISVKGILPSGDVLTALYTNYATVTAVKLNWMGLSQVQINTTDYAGIDNVIVSPSTVPGPDGLALMMSGASVGLFALRRRCRGGSSES